MREIVLPCTGEFARIDRVKLSDLLDCINAPHLQLALVERLVTIDGRRVDHQYLDSMPLPDAFLLMKTIGEELEPAGLAKGVS